MRTVVELDNALKNQYIKKRKKVVLFTFKSELNTTINQINRSQETRKVNIRRNKNENIIHGSEPMRKYAYIKEFFLKIVHINIRKLGRVHVFAFNGVCL